MPQSLKNPTTTCTHAQKVQHTPNACASCCYNMHMPNSSLTTPTYFRRQYIPTCSLYKHKMSYKPDSPSHPHICVSNYEVHKSCSTSWHVHRCLQLWCYRCGEIIQRVCVLAIISCQLPSLLGGQLFDGHEPTIESLLTSGCGLSYKCMEDKCKDTCVNFGG